MRTRFWVLLAAAVVLCGSLAAAQPTKRVGPEKAVGGLTVAEQAALKRELHREISALIPAGVDRAPLRVEITQKDKDDLLVQAPSGTAPLRIGVVKPVPERIGKPFGKPFGKAFNQGVIKKSPDGSFVWAMTVTSPGAQAIRVHFTGFSLPDNTEMYLLGPNGQAHGPYTGFGRNGNGDFWTRSIVSDTVRVVLRYTGNNPDIDQLSMSFRISDVGHIQGRPPLPQERSGGEWPCSGNADCLIDATCEDRGPAEDAKDAVAKMEWIRGIFIYTCTGGLLADTDPGTQIPYFLTANHCISSTISNLEMFFNYTTDECGGTCPDSRVTGGTPLSADTIGVTVAATGSVGDFTLLTLDEAPPTGATFLGWNNTPIAFTNFEPLYRISNPNFGPQVYSQYEVDADLDNPTCTGWPRGERIYSIDIVGATQGGSSGAPVLNAAGEVVGQLSGCCGYDCGDVCNKDPGVNWTVDGALAYYWDSVAEFLDPFASCISDSDCADDQFCNGDETCVEGTCQPGSDPCLGQVCDETGDVCVDCLVDGDCDDGVYCNGAETCVNNFCEAGTSVNCDDGVSCTDDSCNEGTDSCDNIANDSLCDNGSFCDGAETCDAVLDCQSGTSPNCDDGVGCTEDSCNEATDSCDHTANNSLCDNGLFCDGTETCDPELDCQPGIDPCPGQNCDEDTDTCVNCQNNGDCDDGLFCNGAETCVSGVCQAGENVDCDDSIACTTDLCNEATDSCDHTANNSLCDNGLFCDGTETCDPELDCQPGIDPCPGQNCDEDTDSCFECGNGICEEIYGEHCSNCPQDCPGDGFKGECCGDGTCEKFEGKRGTCPEDCA